MEKQTTLRLTRQRQIILEELASVKNHPTANEIYDMVRKKLPRIGLGTVYRNLELMAANGIILKLETGGTQKRFDAITTPHHHIKCTDCGKIDDIDVPIQTDINRQAAKFSDYTILGYHLEFSGLCSSCKRNSTQ